MKLLWRLAIFATTSSPLSSDPLQYMQAYLRFYAKLSNPEARKAAHVCMRIAQCLDKFYEPEHSLLSYQACLIAAPCWTHKQTKSRIKSRKLLIASVVLLSVRIPISSCESSCHSDTGKENRP